MIKIEFEKEELVKSPLNFTGGKYKLLPQILPLFPNNINTFIDLFTGGCNVGINIKANKIICNDIQEEVIRFLKICKELSSKEMLEQLHIIKEKYKLSKTNKEGYLNLRKDYNLGNKNWDMFYSLVAHSFSNQIRFNRKGEFNLPFGDRYFNPNLQDRFVKFVDKLKDINIEFTNKNFKEINIDNLHNDDFIYCDPPYLITVASYNENGGWNENKEKELLNLLDDLHNKEIKFALSNVLIHKGKSNDILIEWSKKYNVHHLNNTYSSCNYHTKDRSKNSSDEVLITNY